KDVYPMTQQNSPGSMPDGTAALDGSPVKKSSYLWLDSFLRIIRSKTSLLGLCIIVLLIITAILAPIITSHSPTDQSIINRYQAPSSEHWLGTDELGRDIYSRIIYGTRISIQIGVIAVGISLIIGVLLGAVAGYFGRWIDQIIMRIIDI